jgi:hypothetical protein
VNVTPDRENVGFLKAISGIENDFRSLPAKMAASSNTQDYDGDEISLENANSRG